MKLQDIINSKPATGFALFIGKIVPSKLGYSVARFAASQVSRNKDSSQYQAVRANQWVVHGGRLKPNELDEITLKTIENTAKDLYDYYHTLHKVEELRRMVEFSPEFEEILAQSMEGKKGRLLVAPHLSNFDLVMRCAALRGWHPQGLSYPEPPGGYQWQNDLRREAGLIITPISVTSMREAIERLKSGGTVFTGVDRPLPGAKYHPLFFGRPASLSDFYIRLALKVGLPITVLAAGLLPNKKYTIRASKPISMKKFEDKDVEIIRNLEAVLEVTADFIAQTPQHWSMYYPVWPEALTQMPD